MSTQEVTFQHAVLRGSAYEVGAAQANAIKDIEGWVQFFKSGPSVSNRPELDATLRMLRRYTPGLEEEMNGFCDTLQIPLADLSYLANTHLLPRHCSHLVAQPAVTTDGHTLMGRNYDFGVAADDLRLCSTFIDGKYAHIGFSSMFFGRLEGMNEHGLGVTFSAGGLPVSLMEGLTPPPEEGLMFWAQIRALLENCKTVAEAQAMFNELPNCGNPVYLIADASGAAVIAEAFGSHRSVRPVKDGFAVATNHFTAEEMKPFCPVPMNHSVTRARVAGEYLENRRGKIDAEGIKNLLTTVYPQGLACHFYEQWFGAMHGVVFDLNARVAQIAFGSPAANPWHTFGFGDAQPAAYPSSLPQEKMPEGFWAPAAL